MGLGRLRIIVLGSYPLPRFMPCPECGASVERVELEAHICELGRLLDFRVFQLRDEVAAFEAQFGRWLGTAHGRFAAWIAERDRLAPG